MRLKVGFDACLALLPAGLLIIVATSQVIRAQGSRLSSWRGGGMGMYADINDERGRLIKVYILRNEWELARVSSRFKALILKPEINPTMSNIKSLALYLSCNTLFLTQNSGTRNVRIEYWEQTFDKTTNNVRFDRQSVVNYEACVLD